MLAPPTEFPDALADPQSAPEIRRGHRALRDIHLAVIGASGRVGSRLLELIAAQEGTWHAAGVDPRIVGVANSRQALISLPGIGAANAVARLRAVTSEPTAAAAFAEALLHLPARPLIVLDCSASADVAARYPDWLAAGIDIVTPNKLGPSADKALAAAIAAAQKASGTHLYDATTVGAQLPLLSTLRELQRAGDRVERFEAVLSGTLSYVLGRVQQGEALSAAVRGAVAEGYAEPHPARDLSGEDAARKLVILLRALGHDLDLADIECVPLVDAQLLAEPDPARFLHGLAGADDTWRARAALAQARRECWVYRASFDQADGRARIAPERVPLDHALARLAPCENKLILHSAFYRAAPLTVSGPGAGIDLTAAGVLGDLLIATRRYAVQPAATTASSQRIEAAA
ncbi:MAG TPA: homoserine dehydrogenase [Rudaea sp.]|jgi:aspartokinase/homoserine dehydrogenase 1|uniref:homoserine dehydrogenase n=1 Tax=Rudaea sp. TaxID=2136325 RepID=UPI002F948033